MEDKAVSAIILVKGSGTVMCNHMLWLDSMDKISIENNDVDNYWKKNILPDFEPPVYEVAALNAAGIPIVHNGNPVFRPVPAYSSAAVGLHLWKKDMNRIEYNKSEYKKALTKFTSKLLRSISTEIENELVNVEDYEEEKARYNLTFLKAAIRFIATGAGGVSIALDALNLQRMDLEGDTPKDLAKFVRNFKEGINQLYSRDDDKGVILEAMLFANFVNKVRSKIPELDTKAKDALMLPLVDQTIEDVAGTWMKYLTTVTTLTGGEDNYGQLKAHVSTVKADRAKSNILQAQQVIDKERLVLQTYLAEQEESTDIVAYLGRGVPFKKKQAAGYNQGQKQRQDASEMLCFKCGSKGHLYRDCPLQGKVECGRCGESHATRMHDKVKEMRDRAAYKQNKAPWRAKGGGVQNNAQQAYHSDADADQQEEDIYERAYSSMIACQEIRKSMDEREELDDDYDIEDVNAMLSRLTDGERRKL